MKIFYVVCKNKEEAKKIAKHLLSKKLIACANIFPIESLYWWQNKVIEDKEAVLICKTTENFIEVEREIKKIHSYEIPCILNFDVKVNKEYENWAKSVIK